METEPKVRFSPMSGGADINILGYLTKNAKPPPGKTNWKGRLSTVDLLVLTSLDLELKTLLSLLLNKQPL